MGNYSLAAKFGSELIGMTIAIAFGLGVVANELLPKSKGNGIGFGFIAYGFGLSFLFPILTLGFISAQLNPAILLTLWITGDIKAQDFFVLSIAEFLGAFIGATYAWLMYLPHFKTNPVVDCQVVKAQDGQALGSSYIDLTPDITGALPCVPGAQAKQIASYNLDNASTKLGLSSISNDAKYFLSRNSLLHRAGVERRNLISDVFGLRPVVIDSLNSMQVDQLQCKMQESVDLECQAAQEKQESENSQVTQEKKAKVEQLKIDPKAVRQQASVLIDQNVKLSIFATRPAIATIPFNFLTELLGTFLLAFVARLLAWVPGDSRISAPLLELYDFALRPFFVALLITLVGLSAGGPTGPSLNPARDLGPRVAHSLLPIYGKGSSEWNYSWIAIFGPFAGGALAGVAFLAIEGLDKGFAD